MRSTINCVFKELKAVFNKSWEWRMGYFLIGGFIIVRCFGLFSSLELIALDFFLRHRPAENQDDHVVIVLIETDTAQNDEEMSDRHIAELLSLVLSANPAVVGLNIFRGEPNNQVERDQLIDLFETHENLFGVEKILPPDQIPAIPGIPQNIIERQFGINDVLIDQDGKTRRSIVGAYVPYGTADKSDNMFRFSLSFRLAEEYLKRHNFSLENYPYDLATPSFLNAETNSYTKVPKLENNSSGYIGDSSVAPVQTLLNFRNGGSGFQIVTSSSLSRYDFELEKLANKVVIIGEDESSFPRFQAVASSSLLDFGITGAELEAHSVSQIINRVLHGRSLIQAVSFSQEIVLIAFSGIVGIIISMSIKSTFKSSILLITTIFLIVVICYFLLIEVGIWMPMLPMTIVLALCGSTHLGFNYQSQRVALDEARKLEAERRRAIERTFNFIHAGPLQTLASLLRNVRDGKLDRQKLLVDLEDLNKEIRGVSERLRQEVIENVYFIDTRRDLKIDLTHPIHEAFYEVYNVCLQKDLPGFKSIKIRSVEFNSLESYSIPLETKRRLCGFLQESLENVGKHAIGTTKLVVSGKVLEGYYCLSIDDNGAGIKTPHSGEGTKFCRRLEELVKGKFSRTSKPNGGTRCELIWPLSSR